MRRPSGLLLVFVMAAALVQAGTVAAAPRAGSVVLSRLQRFSLAADGARGRFLRLSFRGERPWPAELSSFSPHWSDGTLRLREVRAQDARGTVLNAGVVPTPRSGLRLEVPEGTGPVTLTVELEERAPAGAAGILSFTPAHIFEASWPVQTDVVEVETEGARELTYVARHMGSSGEPRIERRPGWTRWVWTMVGLTPPPPELRAPLRAFRAPAVRASILGTWEPVAGWLAALLGRATEPDETVRRLAAEVAQKEPTVAGQVRAVHRLVASTVRHADLDVGMAVDLGGHPAGEVLRRGFGDCVDRSVAVTALLRCLGVECRPMFLCTRRYRPFDPEVPTLIPGDHCVVRCVVDGVSMVLDPGARWHDYPLLPAEDQDVVAFEPETGSFFRTPDTTAGDHGMAMRQEVELSEGGTLEGSFVLEPRGEDAARLREALSRGHGLDAVVEEAAGLPPGSLRTWRRGGLPEDTDAPLRVEGAYRIEDAVMRAADVGVVLIPGHCHSALEVSSPVRGLDLVYPNATHRVVTTRLRLPQGCRLDPPPLRFEATAPGVRARVTVRERAGVVAIDDSYERQVKSLSASDYPAFKSLLEGRAAYGARGLLVSGWRSPGGEVVRRVPGGPGLVPDAVAPARTALREVVVDLREPSQRRVLRQEVVTVLAGADPGVADQELVLPGSASLVSIEGETRVPGEGRARVVPRSAMVRSAAGDRIRVSFPGVRAGARCSVRLEYVEEGMGSGRVSLAGPLPADLVRVQVLGASPPVSAALLGAGRERAQVRQSRAGPVTSWTAELRGLASGEGPTLATAVETSWEEVARSLRSGPLPRSGGGAEAADPVAVARSLAVALTGTDPLVVSRLLAAALSRSGQDVAVFARWPEAPAGGEALPDAAPFVDGLVRTGQGWLRPSATCEVTETAPPGLILDLSTGLLHRVGAAGAGTGLRCRDEVRAEVRGPDLVARLERRYEGSGAASLGRALAAGGAAAGRRFRLALSGLLPGAAVDEVTVGVDEGQEGPVLRATLTLPGAARRLGDGRWAVSLPVVPVEGAARLSALSRRVRLVGPVGTLLRAFGGPGPIPGIFARFTTVDDRSIVWEEERVASAACGGVRSDAGPWPLALLMAKDGR